MWRLSRRVAPLGIALLAVGVGRPALAEERAAAPDFEKSYAAIIIKNCLSCHNSSQSRGKLDLSRREGLFRGGKGGPVVEPGKPDDSYLIERVAEGSMPPRSRGKRLSRDDVARLTAWVRAGAKWPDRRVLSEFEFSTDRRAGLDWWSLQPLSRPAVPRLPAGGWARNPIDAFILDKLRQRHLEPAPEADRLTYLRRAKFDLLGLPPTPREIDAFVADRSPQAYEKLIDRLLASPHYGERWGRHWLDVARFGESDGFENDKLREHAWPYRDYVIDSFNRDRPYPQFVKEQLAGDVLRPRTRAGLIATGFLVAGPWDEIQNVGKSQLERMRTHEEQMEELIGAVGQTFLGMTVNCARCHDHKFDPIPQSDYYRLKAVFDGVDHGNRPLLTPAEQRAQELARAPARARVGRLKADLQELARAAPGDAVVGKVEARTLGEGRFGKALDARVAGAVAQPREVYHQPPLTVECWARLDDKAGFNVLVANHPKESAEHWEIYSYAGSGVFSVYLPGYAPAEVLSGVDVTDGKWHYLAMTFDGRRVRLYVDARLVRDAAVKRQRTGGPAGPLYFGGYPPQKIGCAGLLDEVRISRGLRPVDRVPAGPFRSDDQTVGLWHFDAVEGNRLPDSARTLSAAAREKLNRQQAALVAELRQQESKLTAAAGPLVYAGVRRQPGPTFVLLRGEVTKPGSQVAAGGLSPVRNLPANLGLPEGAPEGQRRLRFAEWVAHPDNPLTARVMVNRIWQYHLGRGLVETPSDLGWHGGVPSHPELLDWLARQFMAGGWSVKQMHRLIMLSAAYRQSSRWNARAARFDSDNRLLWRFTPRPLEAESVRDAMLTVSGELNPRLGGPSFRPFTVTVFNTYFYHLFDRGTPEFNRRTVYRINVNTAKSPLLDALDCPAPSITMPRRRSTTTALQALALMNDSFVQRQAERFAARVQQRTSGKRTAQVTLAYRLALGRPPDAEELAAMAQLVRKHGLASACWVLLNASEFLYLR
jgi:mono/diheme cytochrome c family protein